MSAGVHDFHRDEPVTGPSNRSFGLTFGVIFGLIALHPLLRSAPVRPFPLAIAAVFVVAALAAPALLTWPNRAWLRLGLAMHKVVNPIVMAVLFYGAVTPFGVVRRAFRKGLSTRLGPDRAAATYWVPRAGQPHSDMRQQF